MKTNICLNMIVKNETKVLGRLFESLKDVIDYYVIVDTGSDDGTPEFISQRMAEYGISGEVHSRDWVNFGYNRNEALQYVYKAGRKGWVLFIDADEEFVCEDPLAFRKLESGVSYELEKHHGELRYALPNLVDVSETRWEWRGVVHEYLQHVGGPTRRQRLPEAWILYHAGQGARSHGLTDEEKFLRDAALLEAECARNPDDARSRFYLAQSYQNAGKSELALENYRQRVAMPGWEEENFVSQLRLASMAELLGKPQEEIVGALLKAHEMRPTRAEPLHDLAAFYRKRKQYSEAYAHAKKALSLPFPNDTLFVNRDVYAWRILDELAVAAYWVGRYAESKDVCREILLRQERNKIQLSEADVARITKNLEFAVTKLAEQESRQNKEDYKELLLGAGSRINKDLVIDGMRCEFTNLTRLDINQDHRPDIVWDLKQHPLPFDDNTFDEIHAYEVLEHLAQQGDYRFFFAEFAEYWRILKPGGLFLASTPDHRSVWAWGDPSHSRVIQPETLIFLDQDEYTRQIGVTKMSDFRYIYKAHFKTVYSQVRGESFFFAIKAMK